MSMTRVEIDREAMIQAGMMRDRGVIPEFTDLVADARRVYGDWPWIPRFAAMILSRLNNFKAEEERNP